MDSPTTAPRRASSRRPIGVALLVTGLIALVAAVTFPFMPVQQPRVEYTWPQDGTAATSAAVPLMPYQPVRLDASLSCAALRGVDGGTALSTTPRTPDPEAAQLPGLTVRTEGGELLVTTGGTELTPVRLPAGDCVVTLSSTPERTAVAVDGRTVAETAADVRPSVAGVFTDAADATGLSVQLVADTRFQTTITVLKAAVAVIGVLAVALALVLLSRAEGRSPVRLLPRHWWVPRGPDLVLTGALGLWWAVGPITVDDGYIAGIVRSRDENGFIGNVYRWLNAPEAPFSWFYDLYALWAQLSVSTAWLRLPSIVLTLLTWLVLSRGLLPRLFPGRPRWVGWTSALAFLVWVLSFVPSLRPEPWVALGVVVAAVAAERAVALRRVTPLAVGLLVAGVTTAVTPAGLMAFAPFLAGAVPVVRAVRDRCASIGTAPVLAVLLAAPAAAVFLMVSDQSLAAMLEGTRVRTLIGGGQPWYEEYTRYSELLDAGDVLGPLARRLPVLFTLVAAVAVLWAVARRGSGLPVGPARRVTATFLLGLATMTATPTRWTQHFGDVAGIGSAVLALGFVVGTHHLLRRRTASPVPALTGLAAAVVAGALVLAGWNNWPYVSNWWGLTWSTVAPVVAGYPISAIWLVVGLVLLGLLLTRLVWLRSSGRPVRPARWQPSPTVAVSVLSVATVLLLLGSFTRTGLEHRDSYTLLSDTASALRGEPCSLGARLSVETTPAAGLLPVGPGPDEDGPVLPEQPVDVGGSVMPGVQAGSGSGRTPWFVLDPEQTAGRLPVVVTVAGALGPGQRLVAEFSDGTEIVDRVSLSPDGATPLDRRLMAPDGAVQVRLRTESPVGEPRTAGTGAAVASLPRVPRLTRLHEVVPPGTTAVLDWPVAFFFPCLRMAPLPDGTASVPGWRVGPPQGDDAAGITYAPQFGGPFAGPRMLVTQQRMATYLDGDPTRDAAQVYRWLPATDAEPGRPSVTVETRPGWAADGHARVPGLE